MLLTARVTFSIHNNKYIFDYYLYQATAPTEMNESVPTITDRRHTIEPKAASASVDASPTPVSEEPDLVVKITEPYTPTFQDERNPGNEYRCFARVHLDQLDQLYNEFGGRKSL